MDFPRPPRRSTVCRTPWLLDDGTIGIDTTWGTIQPMTLHADVATLGELEVMDYINNGCLLVDTRAHVDCIDGTIPTAVHIPHEDIVAALEDREVPDKIVLFCNGPQCAATPDAIGLLLDAGYDGHRLYYYRGGMQDWMSAGLPLQTC